MTGYRDELPKYRCHKVVRAAKITAICRYKDVDDGKRLRPTINAVLHFGIGTDAPFVTVDAEYLAKHDPQVGGYYVLYEGGYESWSPAEAFEKGYSPIE